MRLPVAVLPGRSDLVGARGRADYRGNGRHLLRPGPGGARDDKACEDRRHRECGAQVSRNGHKGLLRAALHARAPILGTRAGATDGIHGAS